MAKKHTEMTLSPEAAAAAGIAGAAVAKTLGKAAEALKPDKAKDNEDADEDEEDEPQSAPKARGRKSDKSSPPSLDYDDGRAEREVKEKAEREAKEKAEREAKAERDRLERERDRLERERMDRDRRSRARMDYDDDGDEDFYERGERHDRPSYASRGWPAGGAGTIRPRAQVQVRDFSRGRSEDDDIEKKKLDELIGSLPESERTTFCFSFRKMTPGVGKGAGGGIGLNCGIWYPIGEDWQTSIKVKLAQKYGPGFYEGTIRNQDGSKPPATKDKWTFFVNEEEAEECGWRPGQGDGAGEAAQPVGQAAPTSPAAQVTQASQTTLEVEDDFDPEKEERRAKWIEKRIKVVEAEKRLKEAMGEDDGAKKKKGGGYEEELAKILEAERRAARAERDALEAKLRAEREAEKARLQAEIAAREAKAEADRRELLAAIEREKDQHKRTTDTLQERLDRLARDIEDSRKAPPPPPPDALEIAEKVKSLVPDPVEQMKSIREFLPAPAEKSDIAGTINALGTVLQPLINAAITKLNAPPPPPPPQPDIVQIAETVAKLVHKPEPKQPDMFEVLERAKALMPPPPKPIDPVDLAMKVKELMPAPVDPFAALERAKNFLSPPGKQPNKQDILLEMQQMVEFANSLRAMAGGGSDDDDDDDAHVAAQPVGLTGVLEQIESLKKLGIPVEIGGKGDSGSADKIMAGIEKALYAAGEAARRAGVFGNKPDVDPALQAEMQRQKLLRQRAAAKQRQALTAKQRQQIGMQQRQYARGMPPAPRPMPAGAQSGAHEAEYVPKPMPGPAHVARRPAQPPQPRAAVQARPQQAPAARQQPLPPQVSAPQSHASQPAAQSAPQPTPQPTPQPAPAQATPSAAAGNSTPTSKDWGELCRYVNDAIDKLEDPSEAALHMLEHWPAATMMIADAPDVSLVEMGLTSLSGNPDVGPFATIISELASRIRSDPGRSWAEHLLKALKN